MMRSHTSASTAAAAANIVAGDGTGKVNPKNNITREETAKVLYECVRWLAYTKRSVEK